MEFTPEKKASLNPKNLILIFDIILFFVLLNTLPFDPKANKGLALLVFVAILWLTEALHVTVTALLIPLLAVFLDLTPTRDALVSFANPIIFLFFGGFVLATALHIQKLDRMIANRIMTLARGNLFVATIYLFSATAFLSMWISNTATAAMMLPLAMGVLSKLDQEHEHNTYVFVLLGIAYSASIGGIGTLIGSPPNAIAASQLGLTFSDWLWYGLPIAIILMPLMIGTLYVLFKPKLNVQIEQEFEKIEMNSQRWTALLIFVLVALVWIFSSSINPVLSSALGLAKNIASFDSVVALLAAALVVIFGVASWKQIQENTEWGVLMLFGGGLTLSTVLRASGASKVMADGVVFMIEGGNFYLICFIVAAFIIFLTEFTSNTASAALLVPIFISIAEALGVSQVALALIIGVGASCAFMLPVATPPNAVVFGTGQIKQKEMVRVGIVLNIVSILLVATVAYFFWQ